MALLNIFGESVSGEYGIDEKLRGIGAAEGAIASLRPLNEVACIATAAEARGAATLYRRSGENIITIAMDKGRRRFYSQKGLAHGGLA